VDANEQNAGAVAFYRRVGFVQTDRSALDATPRGLLQRKSVVGQKRLPRNGLMSSAPRFVDWAFSENGTNPT
ncbi:MAG: hypothetical protein AAF357_17970, partial [Verrucomicrobiota bacterium]